MLCADSSNESRSAFSVYCWELPTEHAAAHYPILDLENLLVVASGAEDHRADETVVADSIQYIVGCDADPRR